MVKYLYKYRGFSNLSLEMLANNTYFFASPKEFNDPLDCAWEPTYELPPVKKIIENQVLILQDTCGMDSDEALRRSQPLRQLNEEQLNELFDKTREEVKHRQQNTTHLLLVKRMKILIVGSTHFPGSEQVRDGMIVACKEIGQALAKGGHTIIVGSDNPSTADAHIIEGALEVPGTHKVIVSRTDEVGTPFVNESNNANGTIEIKYRRHRGSWEVSRVHQVLEADAVIVIGGGKGTHQSAHIAPTLKRPVLAIPSFGGAAKEVYLELARDLRSIDDITDDLNKLAEQWQTGYGHVVVQLLERIVAKNPYKHESVKPQVILLVGLLAILSSWVYLFIEPIEPMVLSFIIMLGCSALLGTGLRTVLRIITGDASSISARQVITETTAGVLLAFGLFLVYLAGGLSVTGSFKFVILSANEDFLRVAVTMSLIGLTAGLMIERASNKLVDWLNKMMKD